MHQVSESTKTETTRSAQTIVESASFKQLMHEKNTFILP